MPWKFTRVNNKRGTDIQQTKQAAQENEKNRKRGRIFYLHLNETNHAFCTVLKSVASLAKSPKKKRRGSKKNRLDLHSSVSNEQCFQCHLPRLIYWIDLSMQTNAVTYLIWCWFLRNRIFTIFTSFRSLDFHSRLERVSERSFFEMPFCRNHCFWLKRIMPLIRMNTKYDLAGVCYLFSILALYSAVSIVMKVEKPKRKSFRYRHWIEISLRMRSENNKIRNKSPKTVTKTKKRSVEWKTIFTFTREKALIEREAHKQIATSADTITIQ